MSLLSSTIIHVYSLNRYETFLLENFMMMHWKMVLMLKSRQSVVGMIIAVSVLFASLMYKMEQNHSLQEMDHG